MNSRIVRLLAAMMSCAAGAEAQLSGYSSAGFGYHQNPLYNYEKVSDQVTQTYLELSYQTGSENSAFSARYVGGLMAFNRFADRNFYEHSVLGRYAAHLLKTPQSNAKKVEEPESDEEEESETEQEASYRDSTDAFFELALKASARHDKAIYREFDNQGAELTLAYRWAAGERSYYRLVNLLALHRYSNVSELSNVNDLCTFEGGVWNESGFVYGFTASAGLKYYTTDVYDTTRFESAKTIGQGSSGKGKQGGKVSTPTGKDILLQPQDNGTVQVVGALFLRQDWSSRSSLLSSVGYRWALHSAVRYLAQKANASMMNEDIYNDFFSYEGPEVRLRLTQELVAKIQVILEAELQHKLFGAPALNLAGEQTAPKRKDLRSAIELYASRYFDLINGFGLDIFVSGGVLRNQSNDDYNDYSLYSISAGLGISF